MTVHQFSPRCLHAAVANPALTPAPPADVERGEIFQPDHIELALARELANGTINADLYVRVIGIVPDERRPAKVLTAYLAGVR